jgi:hypothetical protein
MLICYFTLPLCADNIGEIHTYNNANRLQQYNNQQHSLVLMQEKGSSIHDQEKNMTTKNTTTLNIKESETKVAIDTQKKVWPKKMIKLYPHTNDGFWSILKGGEFQMLFKTEDSNYLSFNVHIYKSMEEDKSMEDVLYSNQRNTEVNEHKTMELGFGLGYATYTDHKGFKSFTQHLATISFYKETTDTNLTYTDNNTNNNKGSLNGYSIAYKYILGVEKEIITPFSVGIETTLVNLSINNSNNKSDYANTYKQEKASKTISLSTMSEFRIYGKINL